MSKARIAGAEINGWGTHLGKTGHVGPTILGADVAADGVDKRACRRLAQTGEGGAGDVIDVHGDVLVLAEDLHQVRQRLLGAAVGSETEVDEHPSLIRNGVGGHAGFEVDDVEAFLVGAAVNLDVAGLVVGHVEHHRRQGVRGIGAQPGAGRVRAGAVGGNAHADGALAAGLDHGARGLPQQSKVPLQPLRMVLLQVTQAVELGGDLLALIGDDREIVLELIGVVQLRKGVEVDGHARLHVHGAAAIHGGAVLRHGVGHVIGQGYGIDVAGEDHAAFEAPIRPGTDSIAVAFHLYLVLVQTTQGFLDSIGDHLLVVRRARDIHQGLGQLDGIGEEI